MSSSDCTVPLPLSRYEFSILLPFRHLLFQRRRFEWPISQAGKMDRVKITVSLQADKILCAMTEATNKDFSGGKVSKHELASWIIMHFESKHFSGALEDVRAAH